jgi:hypothetical protein
MSTTADEFGALPISMLIGAPLTACCEAQIMLANATADFIRVVGFLPPETADPAAPAALGDLRTATFGFSRPSAADPEQKEEVRFEVPFIACVDVPALSIKTVDITFDMEVKTASASKDSTDASVSGSLEVKQRWGAGSAKLNISGSVASHKENTRSTDTSAKYHISVHAEDSGMPEGLQRVMNILQAAITAPPPPAPALPPE